MRASKKMRTDQSKSHSRKNQRSRSRSKGRRKESFSEQSNLESLRISPTQLKTLSEFNYYFYHSNQKQTTSPSYAIWNICIKFATRPKRILVICESMAKIYSIKRTFKLNRSLRIINQNQAINLNQLSKNQNPEIVMATQKKVSILLALQDYSKLFDLIILTSKSFDSEFYIKLSQILQTKANFIVFVDKPQSLRRLEEQLQIRFQQIQGNINQKDLERQLIKDIQLAPRPSSQTFSLLNELSLSSQEIAGRLYQLEKSRRQPSKSLHLKMPGYITYKLEFDLQFNSLKYVWNFLKEQFPINLVEQVRGMHKYVTQRGVVFNIPQQLRYLAQQIVEKIHKHKNRNRKINFQECIDLPNLQNIQSQQYKVMQDKKKYAIENKRQLQIFIGGVPYQMDQNELKKFFNDKSVSLFQIRILRDQKGFSKGIGFGLCQNKQHFQRAISLNGSKIMDRNIRIKLADQRKN